MITIYGSPRSSSGRCFWCLEEVGAKYDAKSINFKEKEHKSAEYLKINPNGKVPTLVDGDYKIWESMAINFYLADAYKPELLGSTVKDRGLIHQWSYWAIAELQRPLIDIFIQMVFVPEEHRDAKLIASAQGKLPGLLDVLNSNLVDKTYIVGDKFSLADLNVASVVGLCAEIKYELTNYKSIEAWLAKLSQRESFKSFQKLCVS